MCRQVRCNRRDLPLSSVSSPGVALLSYGAWIGAVSQDLLKMHFPECGDGISFARLVWMLGCRVSALSQITKTCSKQYPLIWVNAGQLLAADQPKRLSAPRAV